jgi:hypothetical protein
MIFFASDFKQANLRLGARGTLGPPPGRLFCKTWDPEIHHISLPTPDAQVMQYSAPTLSRSTVPDVHVKSPLHVLASRPSDWATTSGPWPPKSAPEPSCVALVPSCASCMGLSGWVFPHHATKRFHVGREVRRESKNKDKRFMIFV